LPGSLFLKDEEEDEVGHFLLRMNLGAQDYETKDNDGEKVIP
jgi:hypothetical protein